MTIQDIQDNPDKLQNLDSMLQATLKEYSGPDCPMYGNIYVYERSPVDGSDLNRLYLIMGQNPVFAGQELPREFNPAEAVRRDAQNPRLFYTDMYVVDLTDIDEELTLSAGMVNWAATNAALHRIYKNNGHGTPVPNVLRRSEVDYLTSHEAAIWAKGVQPESQALLRKELDKFFRFENAGGICQKWKEFFRSDRYPESMGWIKPILSYLHRNENQVSLKQLQSTTDTVCETVMSEREFKEFAATVKKEFPSVIYAVGKPVTRDEGIDKREGETFQGVRRVTEDEYTAIKEARFDKDGLSSIAGLQKAKWTLRSVYHREADEDIVAGILQRSRFKFAKAGSLSSLSKFGPMKAYIIATADFDNFAAMMRVNGVPYAIDTEGYVMKPKDGEAHVIISKKHEPAVLGILQRIVNANITLAHDEPWFARDGQIAEIHGNKEPFKLMRIDRSAKPAPAFSVTPAQPSPALDASIKRAEEIARKMGQERREGRTPQRPPARE